MTPPRPATIGVALLLLLLPACALGGNPRSSPPPPGTATIVRVIDGDTIVVTFGDSEESVRLIGIDTPETKHPTAPVECFGPEAAEHTSELLPPGEEVRLERDAEQRDRYGRLLAYVYRRSDGLFVNLELVADGFAEPAAYPPNVAHSADMSTAASSARAAGVGMWKACSGADPPIEQTE